MRYFFEEPIITLNDCRNDKFVAGVPNYKKVIVDKIGRIVSEEFKNIEPRRDGFFEVSNDYSTVSLMNGDGKIVIAGCKDIDEFTDDGIALVTKLDGSKCWITKEGFEFGKEYKNIGVFAGGYGAVQLENGKWTFIDKNFKPAGVTFDKVSYFEGDYASVMLDGKFYAVDKEFKITAGPFEGLIFRQDNIFAVYENEPKDEKLPYAYYTGDGKKIGKNYALVHGFKNGMSRVQTKKGYNFIDLEGNEILTETFMTAGNFGERYACVCKFDENGEHTFNFVDKSGKLLTDWYPYAGGAEDDKPFVLKGRKCYYLNEKGKPAGKGYSRLSMTSEGVAHCETSKDKYSYLFENGEFSEEFDGTSAFYCGFGVVRKDGHYDALNKQGHKLSKISQRASQIEAQPLSVLRFMDEFANDPETLNRLCDYAIEVLDYALASDRFDSSAKSEFVGDRKMIETLKLKTMSQIPEKEEVTTGWEW